METQPNLCPDRLLVSVHVVMASSVPTITENPDVQEGDPGLGDHGWLVTVFNNEYNTYEEVMNILMIATCCTAEEAYIETWEIDHLGQSVVHSAAEEECREVASIISKIGIRVEVSRS